jgi:hypothetical protein
MYSSIILLPTMSLPLNFLFKNQNIQLGEEI